jgi:ribosome-binding factor A
MSNRIERANAEIQRVISDILLKDLSDPRISSLITVTSVKTSSDFHHCKIGVSVLSQDENERKQIFGLIKKSSSYIRTLLCQRVKLPTAPFLAFELDEGSIHSERINQILENLVIPPLEEDQWE